MEFEAPKSLFKEKCPLGKPSVLVYRNIFERNGEFFKLRLPKYIGYLNLPSTSELISKLHKVKKIRSLDLLQNDIKPLKCSLNKEIILEILEVIQIKYQQELLRIFLAFQI